MASPDISFEEAFFSVNEEGTFGEKGTLAAFE